MRIIVIYGGDSEEREVSIRSGERVVCALNARGHRAIGYDHKGGALPLRVIQAAAEADALFLALHGGDGENGRLQARLTSCGVLHYTGSCPSGAAMAMAKDVAKRLVGAVGVPVAEGVLLHGATASAPLPYPCVVKPQNGGSSIGMQVIQTAEEWRKLAPSGGILCESYLPGREFTVGILDGAALPVVEIRPRGGVYDYRHKYTAGACEELCPAPIPPERARYLQELSRKAFAALGLRDYARIDLREDSKGKPCFLEANTLPGMTQTSLFPLAAEAAGLSFPELCEKMAAMAAKRKRNRG